MPLYTYYALDKKGKTITGQINADDRQAAMQQVRAMGVFPTDVKPQSGSRASSAARPSGITSGRVRMSDLTVFSRQLANLVRGGLPLMRTFSALTEHTENPRLRAVLGHVQQEIRGGKALWEALDEYPSVFPRLYVSMVKAGEASGQLSQVLQWLAGYLEVEQARKNQIRSALAYPALLLTVGTVTIAALVTFIVPKFVSMFREFGQALPLPTAVLVGVSNLVQHWWWAALAAGVCVVLACKAYIRTPEGRLKTDRFKLGMPLFGKLNLKSSVAKFARTTAILLQGGVTLFDSMTIVRGVIGNEVLAKGADYVKEGMREGESFAARLKGTDVYPPLIVHMVAVGEETGDLQGVLLTVADAYDADVEMTLKSLVSLLEPVIIVIIGGAIAFIILAMLLPVFQINLMSG
jgi:general secretion pathway protein F